LWSGTKCEETVIVVCGPTAIGKTSYAIQLAQHFNTKIISADSRQCYKELNIGVARPSADELNAVPHYFIASHSIFDRVDVAVFEQYALQKLDTIFKQNNVAVVVGGTGLYIKALCQGIDEMPPVNQQILNKVIQDYNTNGIEWLINQVQKTDPVFAASGEMKNPQRMMRALSFYMANGSSITNFKTGTIKQRPFNIVQLHMQMDKQELNSRINKRVDLMIENGLVDEVNALQAHQSLNALQTVGYTEIFDYLNGKHSLQTAIELIKIHTRQYAKRQITWFKKVSS
jgi:tRNA dimethylallyltransferase